SREDPPVTADPPRDEELAALAALRRLAREELVAVARAGTPGRVNRPLVRALATTGLLPRLFPTALGGAAGERVSAAELCLVREALAAECPAAETAFALQGLGAHPILQFGGEALRRRWIPPVARGEAVAAFALTEP